jgi:hypothetical protein
MYFKAPNILFLTVLGSLTFICGCAKNTADCDCVKINPPSTPNLRSPLNGATSISLTPTLAWDSTAYTRSYHLQIASDSLFSSPLVIDSALTADSMTIASSLVNSTKYFWRVTAANTGGISGWSSTWSFTTNARNTPQGVIQQLNDAYNEKDINLYKALFSMQQDFRFYVAPSFADSCLFVAPTCELIDSMCYEIISKGLSCMYYWRYSQEMNSHTKMFEQADDISLRMSPLSNQDIRYTTNGNGETTSVEVILRGGSLLIAEPIQYGPDGSSYQDYDKVDDVGEQVFYLERDPMNPALWVIYKWFDMSQY